jgi:hypothetical protein
VDSHSFWKALAIGILVLASTLIALRLTFPMDDRVMRRTSPVFAGAAGFLTIIYLLDNPALLERYTLQFVIGFLSIVMALTVLLRRVFR